MTHVAIHAANLTWDDATQTWTGEASSLELGPGSRPDRLTVQSRERGTVELTLVKTDRDGEGEVQGWRYAEVNGGKRRALIIND